MTNEIINVTEISYKEKIKEMYGLSSIPTEKISTCYRHEVGFRNYGHDFLMGFDFISQFEEKKTIDGITFLFEMFQDTYQAKTSKDKIIVTSISCAPSYFRWLPSESVINHKIIKKWMIEAEKDNQSMFLFFSENISLYAG
jgi:hypothetical protein